MSAMEERDRLALDLLYAAWSVCKDEALGGLLEEALEDFASEDIEKIEEREGLPIEASREEIGEWLLTGLGSVPC